MAIDHSEEDDEPTTVPDVQDRRDSLRERIDEHTSGNPSNTPPDGNNNKKNKRKTSNPSGSKRSTKSEEMVRDEYIKSLNCWMAACTYWRMYHTMLQSSFISTQFPVTSSRSNGSASNFNGISSANSPQSNSDTSDQGKIYKIPDIWKRASAELIDFLLLLIMKIFVTYIAIDFLDLIDLSKFDFSSFDLEDVDTYQLAVELTSEILVIESVHRFIVIIFETIFLMRNLAFSNGNGGSTPGKKIMGLRVISCYEIQELPGDRVKVTPAGNIGFGYALLRAVIKNFSSIFFLPASLTVFVSIHNRAAYDIACRCIVVEDIARARRR